MSQGERALARGRMTVAVPLWTTMPGLVPSSAADGRNPRTDRIEDLSEVAVTPGPVSPGLADKE